MVKSVPFKKLRKNLSIFLNKLGVIMKKSIFFSAILLLSNIAQADMVRTVITQFQCLSASGIKISVKSALNGSFIKENETIVWQIPEALTAGTEGGPAYMQAVGGGYNISVSGGIFEKAWSTNQVASGDFNVSIWESTTNTSHTAKCRGDFRFL